MGGKGKGQSGKGGGGGKGKGKPTWQVKSPTASPTSVGDSSAPSPTASPQGSPSAAAGSERPPPVWVELEGVPFKLLPCEVELAEPLRRLAAAATPEARDEAVLAVLRAHPFIEAKGPSGGREPLDFGDLGLVEEEHFRMEVRAFNKWLRTDDGRPFQKLAGGPSDDGMYTVSAVLRRCMPRGMSRFTFSKAAGEQVIVRGFRKFTGLTADDEDEESGATNMYEDFYYSADATAARFTVTTKSNGENGKFSIRRVNGQLVCFAGSKNTCLAWRAGDDVAALHPAVDETIPGPFIAAAMQRYWRGFSQAQQEEFAQAVAEPHWTLMLESNCSKHEHIFPIKEDFVEFVAILDREGLPLPQKQAFAFFDKFGLPRVRCEEGIPMSELPSRLAAERSAVDREGAVLYLEAADASPVGLLKVKSNFYVRARRTRQTFWGAIVDPLLRGDSLEGEAEGSPKGKSRGGKSRSRGGTGWSEAERRLTTGMKELRHVEGCADNWKEWADVAVGFVRWWRKAKFEPATTPEQRKAVAQEAKAKYGTLYRDYCRDAGLPGGENV